ncbi:MAG: Gfo/Idh/MocA family oxidoreductase [Chloroflexota bacterium]|nr:Gfo/Idh/MocA family oxidoreductase [Chloroflexota bacterium]
MIGIGVLGAGFMGGTHARAFHSLPEVAVRAIYAPSGMRAEPLAAEVGATWIADMERLLADPAIDAVSICLPTPEHRPALEAALAAGKHVLLEKPLSLTREDADALVARAGATDRIVMIAHVLRFWPEYVELQRIVASGQLGQPISAVATRRQAFPAWSALFSQPERTGGAVIDMLIHDFDALNWLFGAPRSVAARGARNPGSGGWDQAQVLIDYGPVSALVDGGMLMPDSFPFSSTLRVLGDRGAIEYHFRAGGRSVEEAGAGGVNDLTLYPAAGEPRRLEVPQTDPYTAEITYFVDCVRAGQPASRATPADARLALRLALAARAALEQDDLTPLPV